ncbi:MAG: hypothetical protein FRX48_09480 [Lasallia pustulata]|uniref:Uncharacterized protein n=1 Tax=Lasallia pustulata TaxID=136370 RepID=A0A5M8PBT9_9LECA|nr:MAG: hypothetical protein FRX48_09480 [Lasallia pustulata]
MGSVRPAQQRLLTTHEETGVSSKSALSRTEAQIWAYQTAALSPSGNVSPSVGIANVGGREDIGTLYGTDSSPALHRLRRKEPKCRPTVAAPIGCVGDRSPEVRMALGAEREDSASVACRIWKTPMNPRNLNWPKERPRSYLPKGYLIPENENKSIS